MIIEDAKTPMAVEFNETFYVKHANMEPLSVNSDYTKLVYKKSNQKQIYDNKGFGSSSSVKSNCSEYFQEAGEDYNTQVVDNECYILQSQSDATIIIDQQKYDNATVNRASRKVIYYSHMHKSNLVENI